MVEDWHRNIFHLYGEPILENNVTKALINVLENCDKEKVLKMFLERIVSEKINFPKNLKDIRFSMQEPPDEAKSSKQKYVVGISPETEDIEKEININENRANSLSEEYEKNPDRYKREKAKIERLINVGENIKKSDLPKNLQKIFPKKEKKEIKISVEELQYVYDIVFRKSRPDAMIWCNDFAILVENKIYSGQFPSQIERHRKSLRRNEKESEKIEVIEKSWIKDIYPTIKEIEEKTELSEKKQEQESKEKFLLKEFKEYLEAIGLAPFEGFEKEDFLDEEKMKNKIKMLGEDVTEQLKKSPKGKHLKYSGMHKNGWYAFSKSKESSDEVNFSIYGEGLDICVQLHLKINGDLGKELKKKLEKDGQRKDFDKLLIKLPNREDYNGEITIMGLEEFQRQYTGDLYTVETEYIKKNTYKSGKTYHKRVEARLKTIREMIIANVREKKPSWYKIDYKIQAQNAEKKETDIIQDVVSIITKDLWPMYEFILKRVII